MPLSYPDETSKNLKHPNPNDVPAICRRHYFARSELERVK
jgi:hypothetical protein